MTSSASFLRITLAMFLTGVVVLLVVVGSSIWLGEVNRNYSDETAGLRRIRSGIADLYRNLQDAETGQRGYLLTGDPTYLAPYENAVGMLATRQEALVKYTASYPEYKAKLSDLNRLIAAKMSEVGTTIAMAKAGKKAEAMALVTSDNGRNYMTKISGILDTALEMTDGKLRILVQQQLGAANTLSWVTIVSAGVMLVVVGGAVIVIVQHVRDLSTAREELGVLNKGLEGRVSERTLDLVRANQEIQRFAYIVTHDLRAPLVNIMGFLSELDTSIKDVSGYVLADGRQPTEEETRQARNAVREDVPEAMGFIRASTKKMDGLINAILKISREGRRQLQAERIDLQELIRAAADSVQHQVAATGGEVTVTTKSKVIITDRISLEQILGNLFDNAVKYGVKDRPVNVIVTAKPDGPGQCLITVADNGRGILPDDYERIFELFRRSGTQDQPGEGIGLAYVRSLVRNLGGDITVTSEIGQGSTFAIVLPTDLKAVLKNSQT
jgi:signal transduction histidine kinase/uncharacterized protein (UPF0297 family)